MPQVPPPHDRVIRVEVVDINVSVASLAWLAVKLIPALLIAGSAVGGAAFIIAMLFATLGGS